MSTNRTNRIFPAAVAGALGVGAVGLAGVAHAGEPTTQDLMAQIQDLQAKVQQMEDKQAATAPTGEVATVDSVLKDAERRSQLLQDDGGILAGHERGRFFLRSADGNFSLNPNFHFQFRNVTTHREEEVIGGDSDTQHGFEVRRMRVAVNGHVFNPDLTYFFQWEADRNGGGVGLQDAEVQYAFADDWAVRFGQFKDPVFHEENVSSKRQLAADRSLMNELLAGGQTDRIQGVGLVWQGSDQLRGEAILHDGYNSGNTGFQDAGGTAAIGVTPTNWGVAGRLEYFVNGAGNTRAYDDFTARGNTEDILVVGVGGDWSQGGDGDAFFHTADVQWENTNGLAIYGAIVGLMVDDVIVAGDDSFYHVGLLAQAGYMLNDRWEAFGRVGFTMLDDAVLLPGAEEDIIELTGGVNYYLEGHGAKFTVDLTYLPDGSPANSTGIGVLASDGDEFILRGQFQLLL